MTIEEKRLAARLLKHVAILLESQLEEIKRGHGNLESAYFYAKSATRSLTEFLVQTE